MNTINLKAIQCLVALADHKTYSKAALALDCSKGFVSQQIQWLERHYQTQLVLRTTRQVSLTPHGVAFAAECREGLRHVRAAEEDLLLQQTQLSGDIRVASVGGMFGERYVAPKVLAFMAHNPGVKIDLDFSSNQVDLLQDGFDLAVRLGPLEDSSLIARPWMTYRPLLVASPDYLAERPELKHPKDLSQHQLITGSVRQWIFHRKRSQFTHTPDAALHCGSGAVMIQAAKAGVGIAFLPDIYITEELKTGNLVQVLPDWMERTSPAQLIYPPSRYRLKRVQALVEFLLAP